jgi:pilus assembly protein CpaE
MARGTILIANSSPVATRVLSSLFGREGYDVRAATGGGEALAAVKREAPDLVILDVELPDMDGFDLCRRIRSQPALRGVPVLALSPTADLQAKLLGYEAGVDDFVTRETSAQELLARVNVLLERRAVWASIGANPPAGPTAGRTAIFFSLKGGAGTSTLATNTALLLARQRGETVGLLDLALEQGATHLLLDVVPHVDLGVLAREALDPAMLGADDVRGLVTTYPAGIGLLAAPRRVEDAERIGPELVVAALRALAEAYGCAVVDTPSTFAEYVLHALEAADVVVLVTTPDIAGTRAALTALRIFRELQLPPERLLVVLNAPNGPSRIRLESVEQTLGVPVGAVVPYDPEFVQALNEGKPRALREERRPSRTLTALVDLARRIDAQLTSVGPRGEPTKE